MRLLAALVLLGVLGGCAQLGIPAPGGITTPDTEIYDVPASG
jgi:hypothetical protein